MENVFQPTKDCNGYTQQGLLKDCDLLSLNANRYEKILVHGKPYLRTVDSDMAEYHSEFLDKLLPYYPKVVKLLSNMYEYEVHINYLFAGCAMYHNLLRQETYDLLNMFFVLHDEDADTYNPVLDVMKILREFVVKYYDNHGYGEMWTSGAKVAYKITRQMANQRLFDLVNFRSIWAKYKTIVEELDEWEEKQLFTAMIAFILVEEYE